MAQSEGAHPFDASPSRPHCGTFLHLQNSERWARQRRATVGKYSLIDVGEKVGVKTDFVYCFEFWRKHKYEELKLEI